MTTLTNVIKGTHSCIIKYYDNCVICKYFELSITSLTYVIKGTHSCIIIAPKYCSIVSAQQYYL